MAHFRGYVEGNRSSASRLGSEESGVRVIAQSWDGQIRVDMWHQAGEDWVRIIAEPNGLPDVGGKVLWKGPVKSALQ
jgi:hypothetical protein